MKAPLAAPAEIVSVAGVLTGAELAPRPIVTLTALAGATVILTVQVAEAGVVSDAGVQVNDLIPRAGGSRGSVKVAELLPRLATTTAVAAAVTVPAVTVKVALAAPAGTVTEDGMVTFAELVPSPRETFNELGAGAPRLTVQTALAGVASDAGLQASLEIELAGVIVSVAPVAVPAMALAAPEVAVRPVS